MGATVRFCASAELASMLALEGELVSGSGDSLTTEDVRGALTQALAADVLLQASAHTRALIVTRSFVESDGRAVHDAMVELDNQFRQRPNARCKLDLVVLTGSLFDESGKGEESPATATFLDEVRTALEEKTAFDQARIWLVGGVSESGRIFTLAQVAAVLRDFLKGDYLDEVPPAAGGLFTVGSRMIVFPREAAMSHLRDVFAKTVLEREPGVGAPLPEIAYALVAKDCTDFVEGHFALEMRKIDLDAEGHPVIPVLAMPHVVFDHPITETIETLEKPIRDALADQFPHIQSVIASNRETLSTGLQAQLRSRVQELLDQSPARIAQVIAFLSVLLDREVKDVATGQFIETGRPRTLRAALREGYEFFDAITGFDSAQRQLLTDARTDVGRRRGWVETLERQKATAEGTADGSAALESTEAKLLEAQKELEAAEARLLALGEEVRGQDWRIESPDATQILKAESDALIAVETEAALKAITGAKAAADEARAAQRAEEEAMRSYLFKTGLKILGLVLGLLALWGLGLLMMPILFGAIPIVGAPLFGFLGTVAQVVFTKWWGIGSLIAIVGALISAVLRYLAMRRKLAELQEKVDAALLAFTHAARVYWTAYLRSFTDPCAFVKYLGIFETEREIRAEATELIEFLTGLQESLTEEYGTLQERLAAFKLESSATEFVAIDTEYLEGLIQERSQATKGLSVSFFTRVPFSGLLDAPSPEEAVDRLMAELQSDAAEQLFNVLATKSVVDLMRERNVRVSDVVASVDTLLAVDPNAFKRGGADRAEHLWVIRGPEEDYLRATSEGVVPQPILTTSDDRDSIAVVKVSYGLVPGDIIALAAKN